MSRVTFAVLTVLAVLTLAACEQQEPSISLEEQVPADQREDDAPENGEDAEPDPDAAPAETVAFEAGDLFYEGIPDALPAGLIEFQMDNVGNLPHDLTIEELGDLEVVELIDGGESGTGSAELEPGDYTLYCSVPGHRAGGMEQIVTVEG